MENLNNRKKIDALNERGRLARKELAELNSKHYGTLSVKLSECESVTAIAAYYCTLFSGTTGKRKRGTKKYRDSMVLEYIVDANRKFDELDKMLVYYKLGGTESWFGRTND